MCMYVCLCICVMCMCVCFLSFLRTSRNKVCKILCLKMFMKKDDKEMIFFQKQMNNEGKTQKLKKKLWFSIWKKSKKKKITQFKKLLAAIFYWLLADILDNLDLVCKVCKGKIHFNSSKWYFFCQNKTKNYFIILKFGWIESFFKY